MRMIAGGICAVSFIVGFLMPELSYCMDIVSNGKAQTKIIISEEPTLVARYAAEELQYHIMKASGVKLDIVAEKKTDDKQNNIYIGPVEAALKAGINVNDLKTNEGIIKTTDKALYLVGKDGNGKMPSDDDTSMGTLFAVYDWLENQLNAKWIWPGDLGTVVPTANEIKIGTSGEKKILPKYIHTKLRYGHFEQKNWQNCMSKEAFAKYKYDTAVWLRRHRFAREKSFEYGHAFTKYWERFGKLHPEWFALRPDGKTRGPIDGAVHYTQMCVSSPDFHKQIVADWLESRSPEKPWVNCAENDRTAGTPSCNCENCRAWDGKDTLEIDGEIWCPETNTTEIKKKISLTDRYAKYWLAVQNEAKKYDPNATIVAYAYADYVQPLKEMKLNENIIVWIVPPYFYPLADSQKGLFKKVWDGWRKTGVRLVLRPNYFLGGYCMPYIYAKEFGEEFRYAAQNGMIGTDFDSLTSMWAVQGPNLYMLGRLHEKPEMSVDAVLDEYYLGFAPADKNIKEYFEYWEDITRKGITSEFNKKYGRDASWTNFYKACGNVYTPEAMRKGFEMLDAASKAANGNTTALARIDFLRKGLKNAELSIITANAFQKYKEAPENKELADAYFSALDKLTKYRNSIEMENVVNIAWLNWSENRTWSKKVKLDGKFTLIKQVPLFWQFKFDPEETGESKKWFAENYKIDNWDTICTNECWEKQPVGKKWAKKNGRGYDGLAWYRTTFTVDPKHKGKKLSLFFGAVDEACTVWVNGKKLLERPYPYQGDEDSWEKPFPVDISQVVSFEEPNTIAVRVEDRGGNGGIWKPVSIVLEK